MEANSNTITPAPVTLQTPGPSNPAITSVVSPNPDPASGNGFGGVGQWIGIAVVSLTIVSLIMQIILNRKQHSMLMNDDNKLASEINEIKANLKKQLGDKYVSA